MSSDPVQVAETVAFLTSKARIAARNQRFGMITLHLFPVKTRKTKSLAYIIHALAGKQCFLTHIILNEL